MKKIRINILIDFYTSKLSDIANRVSVLAATAQQEDEKPNFHKIAKETKALFADYGSYTASEIANMLNKEFNFSNEQNEDEKVTVSVGTYTCSFPLKNIFYFVSVFEKLASVGRNARQFVFEESGELLGKATFVVSKGMSELCKFVADDELRPVMNYIILDAANNCLVASDGKKLLSFPAKVLEHSGDLSNFYYIQRLEPMVVPFGMVEQKKASLRK